MDFEDAITQYTHRPPEEGEAWMLTFADLLSLILTFFVMLYAISTVDTTKLQNITSSLSSRLNPLGKEGLDAPEPVEFNIQTVKETPGYALSYLGPLVEQKVAQLKLTNVRVHTADDRVVIAIPSDLAFDPGSAKLKASYRKTLADLVTVLSQVGNRVDVVGHTDPSPIETTDFKSNWELSLARAQAVAVLFPEVGYLREVKTLGVADGFFHTLPADLPEAERLSMARRVDIEIRPMGGK
jgi:chemotaxis protein MotB